MYHPVRRPIILEVPNVAFKELTRGVLYARVSCQIVLAIIVASLWRMGYIISTCIASQQRNWKPVCHIAYLRSFACYIAYLRSFACYIAYLRSIVCHIVYLRSVVCVTLHIYVVLRVTLHIYVVLRVTLHIYVVLPVHE